MTAATGAQGPWVGPGTGQLKHFPAQGRTAGFLKLVLSRPIVSRFRPSPETQSLERLTQFRVVPATRTLTGSSSGVTEQFRNVLRRGDPLLLKDSQRLPKDRRLLKDNKLKDGRLKLKDNKLKDSKLLKDRRPKLKDNRKFKDNKHLKDNKLPEDSKLLNSKRSDSHNNNNKCKRSDSHSNNNNHNNKRSDNHNSKRSDSHSNSHNHNSSFNKDSIHSDRTVLQISPSPAVFSIRSRTASTLATDSEHNRTNNNNLSSRISNSNNNNSSLLGDHCLSATSYQR